MRKQQTLLRLPFITLIFLAACGSGPPPGASFQLNQFVSPPRTPGELVARLANKGASGDDGEVTPFGGEYQFVQYGDGFMFHAEFTDVPPGVYIGNISWLHKSVGFPGSSPLQLLKSVIVTVTKDADSGEFDVGVQWHGTRSRGHVSQNSGEQSIAKFTHDQRQLSPAN